jgi:hypothetical protein
LFVPKGGKVTGGASYFVLIAQYYWHNHTAKDELDNGQTGSMGAMRRVYIIITGKLKVTTA